MVERALDRVVLYRQVPVQGGIQIVHSTAETTNSAPYQKILRLGKGAAPTLLQTVAEPAQWRSSKERWAAQWTAIKNKGQGMTGSPPEPRTYAESQRKRKFTAGVMLLALGETNGGGFATLMEASSRIVALDSRKPKTGPQGGIIPSEMVRQALLLCPERREEIAAGIVAGLTNPDPFCRFIAANSSRAMPDMAQAIAPLLIQRLDDTNEWVQLESLFALLPARWRITNQPPAVQADEARSAIERMMTNAANSARVRGAASNVVGYVERR